METLEVKYCAEVRKSRHAFLQAMDPHRPDLFKFCRSLTKTPWDAEDLVQETLAKAYSRLGEVWLEGIANPKSYLFRMASNTWIDQCRRFGPSLDTSPQEEIHHDFDRIEIRDALNALLLTLPPKERVAVLLKDIFDYQLEDIATIMETTVGGVKSALNRGREKMELNKGKPNTLRIVASSPDEKLLDQMVQHFNDRNMDQLILLFMENASGEVYGTVREFNREQIRRGSMGHTIYDGSGKPLPLGYPQARIVNVFGEKVMAIFDSAEVLDDVLRFREEDGLFSAFTSYYFCPEVLKEVADLLQVRFKSHDYYFFRE